MKILFTIGEVAFVHKTGGLGDVGYELPDALTELGVEVEIIMPRYQHLEIPSGWRHVYSGDVLFGEGRLPFKLVSGSHPINQRIKIYLVDEQNYISNKQFDDAKRYGVFSLAIASWLKNSGEKFDVIHTHDWHSALLPLILKRDQLQIPSVLTIHNLLYQGIAPGSLAHDLHLPISWQDLSWDLGNGDINFLLEGILYADRLTTVSPTYALEIQEVTHGGGLQEMTKKHANKLSGILNGISWHNWNPETDADLPVKYNKSTWQEGKSAAKKLLESKLSIKPCDILIGCIGRADRRQKGIPLILELVEKYWNKNWHLVILSQGEPDLEREMRQTEAKFPDRLTVINRYDEVLARLIYAGSDLILIPSSYEPCGLVQLIAMRYGAIPVVRQTGGLADTVFENINGFVFEEYSTVALNHALTRAVDIWGKEQGRLIQTAMLYDSTWKNSAMKYKKLYEKLIAK